MIQPVCILLLLKMIITIDCTMRIGSINSAAYIPTDWTNVLLYKGTYSQCICFAFMSDNSSIYKALNYYTNNNTCFLFTSFVSGLYIQIDTNSKLAFPSLPANIPTVSCVNEYNQCGGSGWNGLTNCCIGLSCVLFNSSYSQCSAVSNTSTTSVSTSSTTTTTTLSVDPSRSNAVSSTYWGCCKPSCSWPGKASVTSPVKACAKDGNTTIGNNTQSVCDNGNASMCSNQQPWSVNNTFSYGYIAASIGGQNESDWCCACYSLLFTSGPINGKEMIVQAVNSAGSGSSNNTLVLHVPGGGWGNSSNGCINQFNSAYSWGQQSGGVSNRSDCDNLPSVLQAGCYWRFDWFMNATNPTVSFKKVTCSPVLTNITGCSRQSP